VRGSPGANDNATGVGALLEISRLLHAAELPISVRFVAFVNEEPPFFLRRNQGSMVYARAARARGDDIILMVALDELGYYSNVKGSQHHPPPLSFFYPSEGNFIAFVSNLRSRAAMLRSAKTFQSLSDFPLEHIATTALVPGVSWSDHRAFWKHGYQAFMITDTAFYRYRHYHKATDTPDKLNYPAFSRLVQGLCRTFLILAKDYRSPAGH
jgi:Zn-dependent M28 family amino/carboxypeptidase